MFEIKATDGMARTGVLTTAHGKVTTPSFKAVATKGAVKYITPRELKEMGAEEIISNAFILSLRPGLDIIKKHGGLHRFMGWEGTIFTDCGGFQVLSLEKDFLLSTSAKGISFKSPFDGIRQMLTPAKTMEIEESLGADVAMALDHMPLYGCTREEAIVSLQNTHAWMAECKRIHKRKDQLLFGIAQGSVFPDLRLESIKFIDSLDFDGIAFGGLAVGEPKEKMFEMIKLSSENCSKEKPRYCMGIGNPPDIIQAISLGVDTFDSVFPTRNARHAHLFTRDGPINIDNAAFKEDPNPVESTCGCPVCRLYTRSYLCHLFRTREPLGYRLASHHNLFFMQDMLRDVRKAIEEKRFEEFKEIFISRYKNGSSHNGPQ